MKKILTLISLLLVLVSGTARANGPDCDPCAGMTWDPPVSITWTFNLPHRPPHCMYKLYLTYQTRQCNGLTQVEILTAAFEDLNNGDPNCMLNCLVDGSALYKLTYVYLLNLIGTPVLKAEPSPCYYTGTVTVPPAARVCMGMQPGSVVTVYQPCDNNGCCLSQLMPVNNMTYHQQVISSTPCPTAPATPPTTKTLIWSCDLSGGGFVSFPVTFTPDPNPVCFTTCYSGFARQANPNSIGNVNNNELNDLQLYPNPVNNELKVGFSYAKEGAEVKVELFDITGKVVVEQRHTTTGGDQFILVNTASLVPGTYGCRISCEGNRITTKISKQ